MTSLSLIQDRKECLKEIFVLRMQTAVFFSKSVRKSVKLGVRVLHARSARASHARRACEAREKKRIFSVSPQSHSPVSASFQTFRLTARTYLNTQKYGLFCSQICPVRASYVFSQLEYVLLVIDCTVALSQSSLENLDYV